jgi:hypothetical protein
MTGMNFRKDLQERREIANRQAKPTWAELNPIIKIKDHF